MAIEEAGDIPEYNNNSRFVAGLMSHLKIHLGIDVVPDAPVTPQFTLLQMEKVYLFS